MYTEREELVTFIYEGHKDAYGVKGRHYNFDAMSIEELRNEADRIDRAVGDAIADEKAAELAAEARFEGRVVESIQLGAESREDAIRWILQAEGLDKEYDAGYICYSLGLPYSREAEFKPFVSWDNDPRNEENIERFAPMHSISVGDVVEDENGVRHVVANFGFEEM